MITETHFIELLTLLLEKAKSNKVHWKERADNISVEGIYAGYAKIYFVRFHDNSIIEMYRLSPPHSSDLVFARIVKGKNTIINLAAEDGNENFNLINALCNEAHRFISGWDVAYKNILGELQESDEIGLDENDVPF